LLVDPANLVGTQLGPVRIRAGSFITDDDRRNNAIRRFILRSDQYATVEFSATQISGLPESAHVGDSFDFQVAGNLTILDRTNPVTFDLTANVVSEDEIQISGATTISRGDYGLVIPSVPFVASVGEDLALEIDLVVLASASS
jgi:polyisoprenoid-binding protein YceI